MPPAAPVVIKSLLPNERSTVLPPGETGLLNSDAWFVVWGPSVAGRPHFQRIVSFALGTDGLTLVPLVVGDSGIVQAATISDDYKIDHPAHYTRSPASQAWSPGV